MKKNMLIDLCVIAVIAGSRIVKCIRVKRELKKLEELGTIIDQKTNEMHEHMQESFRRQEEEMERFRSRRRERIVAYNYKTKEKTIVADGFADYDEARPYILSLYQTDYDSMSYFLATESYWLEEE